MPRILKLHFILLLSVSSILFAQFKKQESINYIKSNLEFLADNLLEGREATSRGEKIASLFIATELKKYGVKPFGENGTYFQTFDMELKKFEKNSTINFTSEGETVKLKLIDDFVLSTRYFPHVSFYNSEAEVVFVGHGIKDDELGYNDYDGLDVKGKIVLAFPTLPEVQGIKFEGRKYARLRQWYTKEQSAREQGAIGIIFISNAVTKLFWEYQQRSMARFDYDLPDSLNDEQFIPIITMSDESISKLLAGEVVDSAKMFSAVAENKPLESFTLSKKVKLSLKTESKFKKARNVIGVLEGINEAYNNQYVTIGAHYDHLGMRGDEIYNGADDNGSGTVSVLEIARELAHKHDNERPILFIFHTGEEKGLLGAKYLTTHTPWIKDVDVHINIDMVGRETSDSLFSVGADKISTELHKIVEKVNDDMDLFTFDYTLNDPDHPSRIYWRSDHVHYHEKNIPIVFFFDYMKTDYHKPTDTVDKINFEKIYKVVQLAGETVLRISNLDHVLERDVIHVSAE